MRRVVLNADDFGYDPAVTRGIVEAMREGVVRSTTMMVNTPHSAAASRFSDTLSIGLHLNLARHQSVSKPGLTFSEAEVPGYTADFVEGEVHAQLDLLRALIGRDPTHIDVHKHLHRHRNVLDGLAQAARARALPVRSIDDEMRRLLRARGVRTNDAFVGDAGAQAYWSLKRLREHLEALPDDGVVELMCHPGYAPETVKSAYAEQREVELLTFTSDEARSLLQRRGVTLLSWAEAMREG